MSTLDRQQIEELNDVVNACRALLARVDAGLLLVTEAQEVLTREVRTMGQATAANASTVREYIDKLAALQKDLAAAPWWRR